MATPQDLLDAQVALCQAETDLANWKRIMLHANLTASIINDKHGPSGRSVDAASSEATRIMQESAKAIMDPNFWGTK